MWSEINPDSGVSFGAILPFSCVIGIPKQKLTTAALVKRIFKLGVN